MIDIAICDNIECMRKKIRLMCEKYVNINGEEFSYADFSEVVQLLVYSGHIDILFLDIKIQEMNETEIMEKLKNKDSIELIIFVSGYDRYFEDIYSSKTRGFIKKPFGYEEVERNIKRVVNELRRRKIIVFKTEQKTVFVRTYNLIYIETMGNYIKVYCNDKKQYIVYGSMKHWAGMMINYGIVRVSSSYMVNLVYIREWGRILELNGTDRKIKVGRKYYEDVKELYYDYVKKSMSGIL